MSQSGDKPIARSGRFTEDVAQEVISFTQSVSFDKRLWKEDIQGSLAHAKMLAKIGILSEEEYNQITKAFDEITEEIKEGSFIWKEQLEDVHMNIEARLTQKTRVGAKLHTARSRNDQISLDMRLWLKNTAFNIVKYIKQLQAALLELAIRYRHVIIPGYTHLQRAQAIPFGWHMLAYVEMLERDLGRFLDGLKRCNVCPLGSGAIAGTTIPVDREFVARELGFVDENGTPLLTQNSLDAVSDRDFIIEFVNAAAITMIHLSRLAEDLVLWSSSEFQFIRLSDAYTTGSSLMPQKRNPDVAELIRGKAARVIGNLVALLTLMKGLPMSYNRDLQEDKEQLFDTVDTLGPSLQIMAKMLKELQVNEEKCAQAVEDPNLYVTDIVDRLVMQGVPFREAHYLVGKLVAMAETMGVNLTQLPDAKWKEVDHRLDPTWKSYLNPYRSLQARRSIGVPSFEELERQINKWQEKLRDVDL